MSETYCLRWDDHESNLSSCFRSMRHEESLLDCTLVCDSDSLTPLHAHKLILTSCSPFFKEMFAASNIALPSGQPLGQQAHPVVYLRGIKVQDMTALLDFMYSGEVNVRQDELHNFIAVAKELKIKGLTGGNFPSSNLAASARPSNASKRASSSKTSPNIKRSNASKRGAQQQPMPTVINTSDLSGVFVKEEQQSSQSANASQELTAVTAAEFVVTDDYGNFEANAADPTTVAATTLEDETIVVQATQPDKTQITPGMDPNTNQVTDLNALVESLVTYDDKIHTCNLCGKKTPWRTTMVRHIESNHVETAGLVCDICGTVSKTRHSFAMHQKRRHDPNYTPSRKRKAASSINESTNKSDKEPPKKVEAI